MGLLKFLLSKQFWISLVIAIILLFVGYYFLNNFLKDFTRKGQHVVVPNVKKMSIKKMPEVLEKNGFQYVVLDSIYNRNLTGGEIVSQKPEAGSEVKEGRKIYLTIVARSAKKIKISLNNVLEGRVRAAMDNLGSMDVVVDSIEFKDYQYNDFVLQVKTYGGKVLKNNEQINAGSRLILVVGRTGNTKVKVPSVVGKTLKEAMYEIMSLNLRGSPAPLENDNCDSRLDSSKAIIIKQVPRAFEELKSGSNVSLFFQCDTIE